MLLMHRNDETRFRPRLVSRGSDFKVVRTGHDRLLFRDLYVSMLSMPWWSVLLLAALFYLTSNLVFACVFYGLGDDIDHAHDFADMFFFSVQTMATIGYGYMVPKTVAANVIVALEALYGLSFFAFITGLVFAKFSRPKAHVMFSNVAVISDFDGVPHLKIRMANQRTNRIVDANVRLYMIHSVTTKEGYRMRRFFDLSLVRADVPLLQLTWTLLHRIDDQSPLFGLDLAQMRENGDEIIVSLVGLDETLSQTVHARFSYTADEIVPDAFFVDVLTSKDGKVYIDYNLFHSYLPSSRPESHDTAC